MKQLKQLQRKPRKKTVASTGFKPQRLVCTYVQRKHFWLCSRQPWTSRTQCLYARWISSLSLMLLQDTDLLNEEDNREKLNWILFNYNYSYQSIPAPSLPSLCPELNSRCTHLRDVRKMFKYLILLGYFTLHAHLSKGNGGIWRKFPLILPSKQTTTTITTFKCQCL